MAGDDSHQSIGAGAGKNTGLKAVGNVSPGSGVGVFLVSRLAGLGCRLAGWLGWLVGGVELGDRARGVREVRGHEVQEMEGGMLGYDPVTKRMDDKGDPH